MIKDATILVIDDDPIASMLISKILKDLCKCILVQSDVEEALDWVNENQPDIILLDVMMPDINGYEACRRLKTWENTQHIPIIFLSSLSNSNDKVKGFEAGGADYITKPYFPDEVLVRIECCLKLYEQIRPTSHKFEKSCAELIKLYNLNEREIKVLNLCASGYSTKEMGEKLFVSEHTAKWYLKNIYEKLNVRNRSEAVKKAYKIGCISSDII